MEKQIEEAFILKEGEEPMDEDTKIQKQRKLRFSKMTRMFYAPHEVEELHKKARKDEASVYSPPAHASAPADQLPPEAVHYDALPPEQWKNKILDFKEYTVIKMPRVFQSIFYMLGYKREDLCERDTNKIEWKKAKTFLNEEFFKKIGEYNPFGPKEFEFRAYQSLRFIEKNAEMYEPENVDEYSVALGKLYRWMQFGLELRKEDVQVRRDNINRLKEERQAALDAAAEREQNRERDLEAARAVCLRFFR
jgi:hypothetical protein